MLLLAGLLAAGTFLPRAARAQEDNSWIALASDEERTLIAADRQALEDAEDSGRSSKIMAARKQLSDDLARVTERRRASISDIVIPLKADASGHFFVDVVINDHVQASLMLDTGAPVVMLSSGFVRKLGVDAARSPRGYVMALNGRHDAVEVSLRSLKLGQAEKHNVPAAVLLDSNDELDNQCGDGLLGLSFLKGYHYTVDHQKRCLILRRSS